MEGVVDYAMRELLTMSGQYDLCVTEFVRVVDQVYKPPFFHRICPDKFGPGHQCGYSFWDSIQAGWRKMRRRRRRLAHPVLI